MLTEIQQQEMYDFYSQLRDFSPIGFVNLLKPHQHNGNDFPQIKAQDLIWFFKVFPTTAVTGLMKVPVCQGPPTGAADTGSVMFDITNNKLYIRNGAAWKSATFS